MQPPLIAGRYQVLRAIGRGGMGTVWLCRDEVLGREVAVKQIGALPGESVNETKRAMREARSAAALNHPNAVAVYDVANHDERPWLVMEYVEGQTLADEISRAGQLSPERVADIGAQLAGALARAHERRIVHRDIKPGNVLIDKAGRPKISDFGIARGHGDDQLTQTGFVTGTPGYLSPELARGGDPDSASDVWALGATLYAAVEGQSPYEPRGNPIATLMAIATGRPRPMTNAGSLRPAIEAMMHEDPARRWDMATSAQRLGRIARGVATAVMPMPEPGDPPDPRGIASQPVGSTQGLDATQGFDATQRLESTQGQSTQRLESTQGLDSTRRLVAAAPAAGAAAQVPPPEDRRGGRRWLPLVLVALLVAALGVPYLLSRLGDQGGTNAVLGTTTGTTPADTEATGSSKNSVPPSVTASVPSTTAAPDPDADKRLESFVKSYYDDVTHSTDSTWKRLAPTMQRAARGRDGYDDFWKTIDKVKVNQAKADAPNNSAVVNLTFTRRDGTKSTENHQLTFVNDGEDYLIESDQLRR